MNKVRTSIFFALLACLSLASCQSYKTIPYLQDADSIDLSASKAKPYEAHIMPQDLLTIVVSCSNPELALPFNLIMPSPASTGQSQSQNITAQPVLQQYLVDNEGNIDFPILGKLSLGGLTKAETEYLIKEKLKKYLKEDPIVTVRMSNFKISVIGEVAAPGTYTVTNEKVNIFEAMALAHDMTVYGKRDNVHIIREDATGHKQIITLNLNKTNIIESPYYYLQQNDIVYVTPNKAKATTADITTSTTIWFSVISSLLSMASIMVTVFK